MRSSQRQFLVKVDGPVTIEEYFATKSGGEVEGENSEAWDGGKLKPTRLGGPTTVGRVTVTRPYDPERDQPLLKLLRPSVNRDYFTVSIQPTDRDLVALDVEPTVYTNALLARCTDPDADAGSGNPAIVELAFDPEDVL